MEQAEIPGHRVSRLNGSPFLIHSKKTHWSQDTVGYSVGHPLLEGPHACRQGAGESGMGTNGLLGQSRPNCQWL